MNGNHIACWTAGSGEGERKGAGQRINRTHKLLRPSIRPNQAISPGLFMAFEREIQHEDAKGMVISLFYDLAYIFILGCARGC